MLNQISNSNLLEAIEGKMFGAKCIKADNGKAVAILWKNAMLFKLNKELTKLWNFDINDTEKYYRFWETPKCSCPKLDNEDRYSVGDYIYSFDCIIHGKDLNNV